ncbi:hypothetical protein [Azospirillum agricola]|uniref:hypothetical protein n=1 Tax=Azospirillum agricola TaxID=1720247 RepID=UPI000A0F3EF1|nr:hypothetical protein [Azospirillum agricola]SMH40205.1 hypothetical protein SAMN02982994_1586 [Azospirillum lipoferum]
MRTNLADRCTSLIGRARAVLSRPLRNRPFIRKPLGRRMRMELLDLELFRNDLHG